MIALFLFLLYKKGDMPKLVDKNQETADTIERLSGLGLNHEQIGFVVNLSKPTLYKYYHEELKSGKAKAIATIASNLFQTACGIGRDALVAQMFFLKTQAGWKETNVVEVENLTEQDDKFRKLISDIRDTRQSEKEGIDSIN
jgi:hypothetical protein